MLLLTCQLNTKLGSKGLVNVVKNSESWGDGGGGGEERFRSKAEQMEPGRRGEINKRGRRTVNEGILGRTSPRS